jgi:hypothetical protein
LSVCTKTLFHANPLTRYAATLSSTTVARPGVDFDAYSEPSERNAMLAF